MKKVYIVEGQTISCDETITEIEGVHTTEEGAKKALREEIFSLCENTSRSFGIFFSRYKIRRMIVSFNVWCVFSIDWINIIALHLLINWPNNLSCVERINMVKHSIFLHNSNVSQTFIFWPNVEEDFPSKTNLSF